MASLKGKIQITKGKWDRTCTVENDLAQNDIARPEISDLLSYTEKRMLTTLIVSGATEGWEAQRFVTDIKTKIGTIPSDKLIGRNGYQYVLQGRIQRASVIVGQVGASGADGTFTLIMRDNYLTHGDNVEFHGERLTARVSKPLTGTAGNYRAEFKSVDGTVFDWATHVAPQVGEKTCFPGFSSASEKSITGYDRTEYPDQFINHTTIQRISKSMSGSASNTVLWFSFAGQKGWMFEALRQMRTRFALKDEHAKIWGKSNMKSDTGSLLGEPRIIDEVTGLPVVQGDGIWEQIAGKNDSYTSGTNGRPTYEDFRDMMTRLKEKAPMSEGNIWYALTGTEGMSNAQEVLGDRARTNLTVNIEGSASGSPIGGKKMAVGHNWNQLNVDGNTVVFIEHPLMSDRKRWTEKAIDGQLIMGTSYVFICNYDLDDGTNNLEILGRGAYGNNRTMVMGKISGLTGTIRGMGGGQIQTAVDADDYHILKEDGIFNYDTNCCGILHRSAA